MVARRTPVENVLAPHQVVGRACELRPVLHVERQMAEKSRDTFAPIGPYIVTADEIADPQKLAITLTVNGAVKQKFNSDDMVHKIPRCAGRDRT